MPYVVLPHTADTGIEATAATLHSLVAELATGMFGIVAEVPECASTESIEVEAHDESPEELVVHVLSELLAVAEIEDLVLCRFSVTPGVATWSVRVAADGAPVASVEPTGPPIKAVTYHDLVVEERNAGWYGRVYFDV